MADFTKSFERTMKFEGGYSCDRDDRGGETYKGISRRSWRRWNGWKVIDRLRNEIGFPGLLDLNEDIQTSVRDHYRTKYWEKICGDSISDQAIADELFDSAVNLGTRRAVRLLQKSLNLLNRDGTLYPVVEIDGVIGPKTLDVLNACFSQGPPELLLEVIRILRRKHYLTVITRNPTQRKFARGWFRRLGS